MRRRGAPTRPRRSTGGVVLDGAIGRHSAPEHYLYDKGEKEVRRVNCPHSILINSSYRASAVMVDRAAILGDSLCSLFRAVRARPAGLELASALLMSSTSRGIERCLDTQKHR